MNMQSAVKSYWKRIFDYSGRTTRPEYWWAFLFNFLVAMALIAMVSVTGGDTDDPNMAGLPLLFYWLYIGFFVVNLVPALSLNVRRLHDQNKTGWWVLLIFVPFGSIVLLVLMCLAGTPGANQYGYDERDNYGDIFD